MSMKKDEAFMTYKRQLKELDRLDELGEDEKADRLREAMDISWHAMSADQQECFRNGVYL